MRAEPKGTLLLADGFSCRTQIEEGTGRRALHLAEAIRLAQEPAPPRDAERWARKRRLRAPGSLLLARAAAVGVLLGAVALVVRRRARR